MPDRAHDVLQRRQLGPGFRRPAHVIQNQAGVLVGGGARQLRIERKAGRIVDDLRAVLQRFFRDGELVRIHRNRHRELAAQPLQDRDQPAQFFGFGDRLGAGARGFRADIDDVRALFFQLDRAREGGVRVEIMCRRRRKNPESR